VLNPAAESCTGENTLDYRLTPGVLQEDGYIAPFYDGSDRDERATHGQLYPNSTASVDDYYGLTKALSHPILGNI
jgi:hypothetical protein